MRCRGKFPAKKEILVDLAFFSCAPGFHKIRYISWVNDGIAGKLILQLTNMMSCSARGHLKVNKSWIFLKYTPGVLKTSAEISPVIRAGAQPKGCASTWTGPLISRGLAIKVSLARHYRSRANRPSVLGMPAPKSRRVGWFRI